MPDNEQPIDLESLRRLAAALAEMTDLVEVKLLRDKAAAAGKYFPTARFGRRLRNVAAEIKLRAERRAGALLLELIPHGGNRRSNGCDRNLRLVDVGIDPNQSARWRREAAVPDVVFERYVALANQRDHNITSQGLLTLARRMKSGRSFRRSSESDRCNSATGGNRSAVNHSDRCRNGSAAAALDAEPGDQAFSELLAELANHRNLLAGVLKPICTCRCGSGLDTNRHRLISRVLAEMGTLIRRLDDAWQSV